MCSVSGLTAKTENPFAEKVIADIQSADEEEEGAIGLSLSADVDAEDLLKSLGSIMDDMEDVKELFEVRLLTQNGETLWRDGSQIFMFVSLDPYHYGCGIFIGDREKIYWR